MSSQLDQKEKKTMIQSLRPKEDPHREELVHKYNKEIFAKSENEGASDMYSLMSVLIAMYAMWFRDRWGCWVALALFYTSVINARFDTRGQTVMTGLSIIIISFMNIYVAPQG